MRETNGEREGTKNIKLSTYGVGRDERGEKGYVGEGWGKEGEKNKSGSN
jgi:hypothetical protein